TPGVFQFKFGHNQVTRHRPEQLKENVLVLEKALDLCRRIANMLDYDTWADYITEVKMPSLVRGCEYFLDDLEAKLCLVGEKEREILLNSRKRSIRGTVFHLMPGSTFGIYRYYDCAYAEKALSLDEFVLKSYFYVPAVVPTILKIYQDLLGIRITSKKTGIQVRGTCSARDVFGCLTFHYRGWLFGTSMQKTSQHFLDIASWTCSSAARTLQV
ncbi:hypothetical protein M405DRAFT_744529, partial [Rhizopogon salebrosus TDB-379]